MTSRQSKLINGFLVVFSSVIIFISAGNLARIGAAGTEGKIAALFLLLNPLIILLAATFGIFWIFFYVAALVWLVQKFIHLYPVGYLIHSIPAYIFTGFVSFFAMRRLYSKIKTSRIKLINALDRQQNLHEQLQENERINTALEKKFERFSRLKFVAEELSATLALEEVTRFAVNRTTELIPKAGRSLVSLVDENNELHLFSLKTTQTQKPSEEAGVDIFDRWILRHIGPLIVMDARKDFRFAPEEVEGMERDVRSLIAAPLISENRILGILRLDSLTPENFNSDDLRILDIFSDLVAVAVENALLYRKMEELARRDGLTNLFVPRYFHSQLEIMINRNGAQSFALLMLDIDYFKEYNDRYGHIAGDIVLKRIANTLTSFLKENDFAVRYGGEEFLLVLVGSNRNAAIERAEAIRKEISGQIFSLRRQETRVTVSIGIAAYPSDGRTKEELLHKADEWLYYAKEKGRNRIAFAGIK